MLLAWHQASPMCNTVHCALMTCVLSILSAQSAVCLDPSCVGHCALSAFQRPFGISCLSHGDMHKPVYMWLTLQHAASRWDEMVFSIFVMLAQVGLEAYILGTLFHYVVKKDAKLEEFRFATSQPSLYCATASSVQRCVCWKSVNCTMHPIFAWHGFRNTYSMPG